MDKNVWTILIASAFILALILLFTLSAKEKSKQKRKRNKHGSSGKKPDDWVSPDEFVKWKYRLKPYCYEKEADNFLAFLKSYKGGFVRRNRGKIIARSFLGREKGDLKGIFYHVIVPNPNIPEVKKEEFRKYFMSVGVYGLEERPDYASCTELSALDEENLKRKAVGNRGEHIVQVILAKLDPRNYYVINGAVLRHDRTTKEYDHIVVCREGIFMIETKAFALTDGKTGRATLRIDEGDHWIVIKNGREREVKSPTEQIKMQKKLLERIIHSCPAPIHPVLALSNTEISIEQNLELHYKVVRADALTEVIAGENDRLSASDLKLIRQDIGKAQLN